MRLGRSATSWIAFALSIFALVFVTKLDGAKLIGRSGVPRAAGPAAAQAAAPAAVSRAAQRAAVPASAEQQRALLDKYCVSCHSERLKTANLSLQGLDL